FCWAGGPGRGVRARGGQSDPPSQCPRRSFLQAGAMATASALTVANGNGPQPVAAQAAAASLPTRKLGETGQDVTILNLGTWLSPALNRLLRFAYASGVRYFDTAESYGSEPGIARWFQEMPEVRSQVFLVTKDHPNTANELIAQLDQRLATLQVDYVDLFLIHALGPDYGSQAREWPRSRDLRAVVEAIKRSGKARFVGFSTHDADRA